MEIQTSGYNVNIFENQPVVFRRNTNDISFGSENIIAVQDNLVDENCEDFFNYLDRLGLANDSNLLVIPSTHHYYFDAEDLKKVQTVINLKQLNHVKQVKDFLRTISNLLPQRSNFVGCFVDNKTQNGYSDKYINQDCRLSVKTDAVENGITSKNTFLNRMYSLFDSKTNRYLTRRTVTQLLKDCGLQIVGMTELNGLTYFCTQKSHSPAA